MSEFFYNFTVNGKNRGYSYLFINSTTLYSHTEFWIEGGELYRNVFHLRIENGRISASKHDDSDWVDLSNHPPNHFPGSAYPLLLPKAVSQPTKYVQIREDDGAVLGEFELRLENQQIIESHNGKITRRFFMNSDIPVRIDWGGAISELCQSADERPSLAAELPLRLIRREFE